MNKYSEIEVSGRGVFPYDMLRYGQCYPANTTDAHNLEPEARERRTIRLATYSNPLMLESACERFRSFLWTAEVVKL